VLMIAMSRLIGELAGIRHPLARFATAPDVAWSDLAGFGRTAGFHWSMLYWSAVAGVLLLVAIARWRGRRERVARVPAIALLAIAVAGGAFIAVNTNNLDLVAWRAKYEKNYKRFASMPQPRVIAVDAHFDLHPDDYRYRVRGRYVLRNDTGAPIDSVLVTTRRGVKPAIVAVSPPLAPGKAMTLNFELEHAAGALESADYSYVTSARALPFVGYVGALEIDDPRERRRRGLPPVKMRPEREIPVADWVTVDLTVSTSADHRVVAPGTLQREWEEGSRRHFRFRSGAPIPAQFGIGSARYAVTRGSYGRVAIELHHHPRHAVNVPRMLRAASESLRLFEESFGPYPHLHLRVAEVSMPNFSGFAQPGVVFLGETRAFLFDARDPRRLDITWRRVAHEIAHQWWGYTLIPADVPGAATLTESLTKYSEQLALEKEYGVEALRQLLAYDLDLYLSGRTGETGAEPPLARAGDQSYLYYRKGAIVMNGLKDLLGADKVNAALRNLLREHGGPSRRPTTAHLIEQLHAVAPPPDHALIDEWMNEVVLYDLKLDEATAIDLGKSVYAVTLTVTASKQRATGEALPMNETIAIAVGENVTKHALRSGTQQIRVTTVGKPVFATVDPNLTRVDRNRFDNTVSVNIQKRP
jgi:ABC-2 type transport system permease protein